MAAARLQNAKVHGKKRRDAISKPPIIVGSILFLPSGLFFLACKTLPIFGIFEGRGGFTNVIIFGALEDCDLPSSSEEPDGVFVTTALLLYPWWMVDSLCGSRFGQNLHVKVGNGQQCHGVQEESTKNLIARHTSPLNEAIRFG